MTRRDSVLVGLLPLLFAAGALAQQVGPLPDITKGNISVNLIPVATGLGAPDYAFSPPGDASRLFVLEQRGQIRVILNGSLLPTPALDIQARVSPPLNVANANDERGLLGIAFHPGYADPASPGYRTLYTYNSEPIPVGTTPTFITPAADPLNPPAQAYKNVVNEWKISAADPNVIDPASRREVVSFGKVASNHNGGTVAFGPDGYLYLALGDGGNANDVGASHHEPGGNAQWLQTPLGKFLRFDPVDPALTPGSPDAVSGNGQYRIPNTNPFNGPGEVREIFAYGVRNPYRYSFDRLNGRLIHSDVGQNNIEEIDEILVGGNYGWAVKEGDFLFNRSNGAIGARSPGSPAGMTDPLSGPLGTLEYDHSDGISITGGFVYRGSDIPELYGKYVFGDLALRGSPVRADGRLFWADLSTGEIKEFHLPQFPLDSLPNGLTVHGFGQDANGEIYAAVTNTPPNGSGGILYKFGPIQATPTLVELFRVVPAADGIRIDWRLSDPAAVGAIELQRSASADGGWSRVNAPERVQSGVSTVLDTDVAAGQEQWYRLSGTTRSGTAFTFGPVSAKALAQVNGFALAPLAPNPSRGHALVTYAVPAAARVRLSLTDVQGREVARLADGVREAGQYTASLEAGDVKPGMYFVRLQAKGVDLVRRLAIVR